MPVLFTIGYEGADLASLLAVLSEHEVEEVVDVRLTPLSRKRGFSKKALAQALSAEGISYTHWPVLGCPKDIRVRYHETGDFVSYACAYRTHVVAQVQSALRDLAWRARSRPTCLLCFERDDARCHRTIVAKEIVASMPRVTRLVPLRVPSSGRTCR